MRSLEQCQSIVIGSRKDRNFSIAKEILVCVLFFCLFSFLSLFFRPPFINGRPQDSDSVFGEKDITPIF